MIDKIHYDYIDSLNEDIKKSIQDYCWYHLIRRLNYLLSSLEKDNK